MHKIAFLCLGNICRSPAMQGIFQDLVDKENLSGEFYIDSFGTSPAFIGAPTTASMQQLMAKNGIHFEHNAQLFESFHYDIFDLFLVAHEDIKDLLIIKSPKEKQDKIHLLTEYSIAHKGENIPDPFKGDSECYSAVYEMIEESCIGLLRHFKYT